MVKSGDNCTGYHPCPQVKPGHTSDALRMGNSKSRAALLSPVAFQVGTSSGVGDIVVRHEEWYDSNEVSFVDKIPKVIWFRSQDGC